MPWDAAGAKKHNKKLTDAQAKKWASIANSVLKECQSKGGKDCEGKAIRVANSKFSEGGGVLKHKVPSNALCLSMPTGSVAFSQDEENPKLSMTIYSGDVIKGHWWWGDLAIDLTGMSFPKKKYPLLEDHDTGRKLGFFGKPKVDGKLEIDPDTVTFLDTKEAEEFKNNSKKGFPYQASMRVYPTSIERVKEEETVEVNGYKFKGPGSIFRKSVFEEGSVCVFGWDKNTNAQVFGKDLELEYEECFCEETVKEVEQKMDIVTLKKEHPEIVTELVNEVTAKFAKEKEELTTQFEDTLSKKENEMKVKDDRILLLEKKDALRTERELRAQADSIWIVELSKSQIPENLHPKVMKHVQYSKYVTEDMLDVTKFKEAIREEIEDWEERGAVQTVLGMTSQQREVEDVKATALKEENEKHAGRLLKLAGQVSK